MLTLCKNLSNPLLSARTLTALLSSAIVELAIFVNDPYHFRSRGVGGRVLVACQIFSRQINSGQAISSAALLARSLCKAVLVLFSLFERSAVLTVHFWYIEKLY